MDSLNRRLNALSSANDFLEFFGVDYDERVVHVNRLHILKRFYQYIRQAQLPAASGDAPTALDEVALFRRYRELLQRAYRDFTTSTAAQEKVFKVFQDTGGTQHVGIGSLHASLAERRKAA